MTDDDNQPEWVAAVDLGSNSFHLIVARYEHGQLQVIDRLREMVRLAAGLDGEGNLHLAWIERATVGGPTRLRYLFGKVVK